MIDIEYNCECRNFIRKYLITRTHNQPLSNANNQLHFLKHISRYDFCSQRISHSLLTAGFITRLLFKPYVPTNYSLHAPWLCSCVRDPTYDMSALPIMFHGAIVKKYHPFSKSRKGDFISTGLLARCKSRTH